jgi:endonuclease YncB( thermonuclease family)
MRSRSSRHLRLVRNNRRKPVSRDFLSFLIVTVLAGAAGAWIALDGLPPAGPGSALDRTVTSAFTPPPSGWAYTHAPRPMPVCGSGRRVDCVVDGDTVWLSGIKIRIVNIDAPEIRGRCPRESARARLATRRLAELLDRRPIRVAAEGRDRYRPDARGACRLRRAMSATR